MKHFKERDHIFNPCVFFCFFNITTSKIIRLKQTIAHFNQNDNLFKLICHSCIRIFLTTENNFGSLGSIFVQTFSNLLTKTTYINSIIKPIFSQKRYIDKVCDFVLKPESFNSRSYDLNKIRPISISNCLAQIQEKLIVVNSSEPNKEKTSCNHAIFVLKETILNYINKGFERIYISYWGLLRIYFNSVLADFLKLKLVL
ncbi:hypothetical protein BpHYR1_031569 [Brachionus plicatilis]|uniref:RNA-directed DNA polymerase from mobile element jockey-like n=1 Tax=Brachionus plicatilis TaxID=10195 RepID=A0A3M7QHM2_BRAPC|nr:hypothetical protein BpHYR1_031569 [Brachionus plicatilis]